MYFTCKRGIQQLMIPLLSLKSCMHTLSKLCFASAITLVSENSLSRIFRNACTRTVEAILLMHSHNMPGRPNAASLLSDPPQVSAAHRINCLTTEFSGLLLHRRCPLLRTSLVLAIRVPFLLVSHQSCIRTIATVRPALSAGLVIIPQLHAHLVELDLSCNAIVW